MVLADPLPSVAENMNNMAIGRMYRLVQESSNRRSHQSRLTPVRAGSDEMSDTFFLRVVVVVMEDPF